MDCFKRLSDAKIIPVAVIDRAQRAIPTALAMAEGGIDVMEITFRTAAAEDALCAVSKACPEILTGAGTVITLEQCRRAVDAGVRFIPTGGIDAGNLSDYLSAFFVLAVGGSWVCPRADIAAGSYEKITKLCRETRRIALACAAHTLEKERSTAL